jgi:hypothetical protein
LVPVSLRLPRLRLALRLFVLKFTEI